MEGLFCGVARSNPEKNFTPTREISHASPSKDPAPHRQRRGFRPHFRSRSRNPTMKNSGTLPIILSLSLTSGLIAGGPTAIAADPIRAAADPRATQVQPPARSGERWALLIGVDRYDDPAIRPLRFAGADVSAVGRRLVQLGYTENQVVVMTTADSRNAAPTRANVLARLRSMLSQMRPEDTLLIYFAGHGFQPRGRDAEPYLGTADTRLGDLRGTGLAVGEIRRELEASPVGQVIFISDACRNDPDRSVDTARAADAGANRNVTRALTGMPGKQLQLLFACSDQETSEEAAELGHGVFTYYLLQGLRGRACDEQRRLTAGRLAGYVAAQVEEHTRGRQKPWEQKDATANLLVADRVPADEMALSGLGQPTNAAEIGFRQTQSRITVGPRRQPLGNAVTFGGSLEYALNGDYRYFTATVGLNSQHRLAQGKSVTFQALLDGKPAASVPVLETTEGAQSFAVDLKGARTMQLRVLGDENQPMEPSVAWWGDAKFTNDYQPDGAVTQRGLGGERQLNICFSPAQELGIQEWDLVVDGEVKRTEMNGSRSNVTIALAAGEHSVEIRWRGNGVRFRENDPVKKALDKAVGKVGKLFGGSSSRGSTDQRAHARGQVRFQADVRGGSRSVTVTVDLEDGVLEGAVGGKPKLRVSAVCDGKELPVTRR